MLISVDLGYGYTKAATATKKVIFPSVTAPATEGMGFNMGHFKHVVEYKQPGKEKKKIFVGESAQKEGRGVNLSLARNKFIQEPTTVMAMTAAHLLGAKGETDLLLGLPIAYYRIQREQVASLFASTALTISVNNDIERYISFKNVTVYPQAVGALYTLDVLPEGGLLGIVDIGFHTTDYLLVQCTAQQIIPLKTYTGSIEIGVNTAIKNFAEKFLEETQTPINLNDAHELWRSGREEVTIRLGKKRKINVKRLIEEAREQTGKAITQNILANWSEKINMVENIYLAGGGAKEFEFKDLCGEILPDACFANALGFLELAKR